MNRENSGIQKSVILLFLLHLMVCLAFYEYEDFRETGIFSENVILETPHHVHPAAARESTFQNLDILNASYSMILPPAENPFQQASYNSFHSLSSDLKSTIHRC